MTSPTRGGLHKSWKLVSFCLWNTGLETQVENFADSPPHLHPGNHLEIFCQACFTLETVLLSQSGFFLHFSVSKLFVLWFHFSIAVNASLIITNHCFLEVIFGNHKILSHFGNAKVPVFYYCVNSSFMSREMLVACTHTHTHTLSPTHFLPPPSSSPLPPCLSLFVCLFLYITLNSPVATSHF